MTKRGAVFKRTYGSLGLRKRNDSGSIQNILFERFDPETNLRRWDQGSWNKEWRDLTEEEQDRRWSERKQKKRTWIQETLPTLTVHEVLLLLGESYVRKGGGGHYKSTGLQQFEEKLTELGLTPEDWPPLAKTIPEYNKAMLGRAKTRNDMLMLNVAVLGMSWKAHEELEKSYYPERKISEITVLDLLSRYGRKWNRGRDVHIKPSLEIARAALRVKGFTELDGPFLYEAPTEQEKRLRWAKILAKGIKINISIRQALKIYDFQHDWKEYGAWRKFFEDEVKNNHRWNEDKD